MKVSVEPGIELNVRHHAGSGRVALARGGTPYLLVHGLSSNARLWDEVAAHLPHPSWAVDLRSHGESDAPPHGYDTATAAADLSAVITALGLDQPVVVGQSWGGNVVAQLAAKRPDLVSGVGLVDGGWIDLSARFPDWAACDEALRPPAIDGIRRDDMREWITNAHTDWSATAVEATLANMRVRPDGTVERRLPIDRHMAILRSMWDEPAGVFLPLVTAPALLLPAKGPTDPEASMVTSAAALMSRARIVWYPRSDHDLHAQHPVRLAADLATLAG